MPGAKSSAITRPNRPTRLGKSGPVPQPRSVTVRLPGSGTASIAASKRVLDPRLERVEEDVVIPRRVAVPLAVLVLHVFHGLESFPPGPSPGEHPET